MSETATSLATIAAFIAQKTPNKSDDECIAEIQQAFKTFDFSVPVSEDDFEDAVFDLLQDGVDLTPTEKDDKALAYIKTIYGIIKGKTGVIGSVLDRIRARREKRKNR